MVPGRTLSVVALRSVLLNSQHVIGGGDKWEERNDDGSDADCFDELATNTGMARNSTRNAQCAYQCQCPEKSPGQVKGRVECQPLKNNM